MNCGMNNGMNNGMNSGGEQRGEQRPKRSSCGERSASEAAERIALQLRQLAVVRRLTSEIPV